MLIEDILGRQLILEMDDDSFAQSLNSIILRLRMSGVPTTSIQNLIGELDTDFAEVHLDPYDLELRNKISSLLTNNHWAEVDGEMVKINDQDDVHGVEVDDDAEENVKKGEEQRKSQAGKTAMKNVRSDSNDSSSLNL